jgi:hypothetical protein
MATGSTDPVMRTLSRPRQPNTLELFDDHFPLLVYRWVGQVEPQHVLSMIRFVDAAVERGTRERTRIANICDASAADLPSPLVRDMLGDWVGDRSDAERKLTLASFVVAPDPLIRGVIASIKWTSKHTNDIHVVASVEAAIEQSYELFEHAGPLTD